MTHSRRSSDDCAVATALTPEAKSEDWSTPRVITGASDPEPARAEWLWPLLGLALLGAFLAFVVDDYPLRTLFAGN
jgi:hypothetical protein